MKFIILVLLFLSNCSSGTQDITVGTTHTPSFLSGHVVQESGKPFAGIMVYVSDPSDEVGMYKTMESKNVIGAIDSVLTDSIGYFQFNGLENGDYEITGFYKNVAVFLNRVDEYNSGNGKEVDITITDVIYEDVLEKIDSKKVAKTVVLNSENCDIADSYITSIQSDDPDGTSSWANINFGVQNCLNVGAFDDNTKQRSLIKFDLDSFTSENSIDSAFLELTIQEVIKEDNERDVVIYAHTLLVPWLEGTGDSDANSALFNGVTAVERFYNKKWNTVGVGIDDEEAQIASFESDDIVLAVGEKIRIDITDAMNQWVSGTLENNGLLLVNRDEFELSYYRYAKYHSSETADVLNSPALKVFYK